MTTNYDRFTHLDEHGHARMVNVTAKAETQRLARAQCRVVAPTEHFAGDELQAMLIAAQSAGLQAVKRTPLLIPLCHSLSTATAKLTFTVDHDIRIECVTGTIGRTGVEMEALTACAAAALTIIAGLSSRDVHASMHDLTLLEKIGGKSGHWTNPRLANTPSS